MYQAPAETGQLHSELIVMRIRPTTFIWAFTSLISLFLVVTYYVLPLAQENAVYIAFLSVVSGGTAIVVAQRLLRCGALAIHLWAIYIALLGGYYVKLGALAFYYDLGGPMVTVLAGQSAEILLGNENVLVSTYELITVGFFSFGIAVLVLTRWMSLPRNSNVKKSYLEVGYRGPSCGAMAGLLVLVTVVYVVTAYVQVVFVIDAARQGRETLPFRLPGFIQAFQKTVIPLMFLYVIWAADAGRMVKTSRVAVALYLLVGFVSAGITTSRVSFIFPLVSVVALWMFAGTVTRKRLWIAIGGLVFIFLYSALLADIRSLRSDLEMPFFETIISAPFREQATDDIGFIARSIAIMMRWSGIDSLISIVNYGPEFSIDRLTSILTGQISTDQIYGQEIIGLADLDLTGVAFAPSLLGTLYLLTGSAIATCISVGFYTAMWHVIFRYVTHSSSVLRPALLALLLLLTLFYTSEGTVDAIPFTLVTLGISVLIVEHVLKVYFGARVQR